MNWDRVFEVTFVTIFIVVIVAILVGVYAILSGRLSLSNNAPCWSSTDNTYLCRKYQIEQCLADERWDEATCIKIVGGGK